MAGFCGRILLPLTLLAAATLERSLISLVDLLVFFVVQFAVPKSGYHFRRKYLAYWNVVFFSVFIIIGQVVFHVLWLIKGKDWSVTQTWWAKLIGFVSVQPWGSTSLPYFLALQLAAALVSTLEIYGRRIGCVPYGDSLHARLSLSIKNIGSHLRVACCLLLPAVQLVVGIGHPSWISLPFFICSCIGLVDWSLTSNFLGLFRWWRFLLTYAGVSIALLYVYQLPIMWPNIIQKTASFMGFYKFYEISNWNEALCGVSLLTFFFMLSCIRFDLYEMDSIMSTPERSLTEQLLPSRHLFFIRESRSGVRSTNVFLKGAVYRNFSINFFTYGFPVLLLALSFWSFNFASFCAFGLLAYVGYIILAFPSLFHLYRLNGLLLVFILFWAASTYIFNVAFAFLNKNLGKEDMEIWETIGLWHYPIPGFFLLAQFCLGILVAMGNLVNNSVFLFLSDEDGLNTNSNAGYDGKEETKVLIVATVAWGLRKCARAITLALIFLLATQPGLIHAIYMIFFLVYLLSHKVNRKARQALIILCETHFALLYMLKLNLISKTLHYNGTVFSEVLQQLGLLDRATASDFGIIAVLSCFCAIHNNGFKMLVSFSDIVQNTPFPPFGFSILKAGLSRSVLLSVYSSPNSSESQANNTSSERRIAAYLTAVGMKFLSAYRSYGTYIALVTILLTVYKMNPNYIAFGYLFLLLIWIIGRQLVEKTRRRLWFPLKIYSLLVFILIYSLSIFPSLETKLSVVIDLYSILGYKPKSSLLANVWKSLAVLIVMQLYSYERRQRSYIEESAYSERREECGAADFFRRLLIWHCDKILSLSVFYASISPISVTGFVYLFGLVISSTLPKASRIPSKLFLVYSGLLAIAEYAFQLIGNMMQMFPDQRYYYLSRLLGFQKYDDGFWGLEFGLRGKILVIVACALQYNVFHWLQNMSSSILNTGKWEEPCQLFATEAVSNAYASVDEPKPEIDYSSTSLKGYGAASSSWPSFRTQDQPPTGACESENNSRRFSFGSLWGISGDSQKWNKRRILALKMDRFELQTNALKIYLCFWLENIFNLFGLEINMWMLLVASFAVLNAISMLYVLSVVACVLLSRSIIRKVWPAFVFIFASVLILEYFAIWKYLLQESQNDLVGSTIHCHDCWRDSTNYFDFCKKCWIGLIVDDPRTLISYYLVFLFASFKLRSDRLGRITESHSYRQMMSQQINVAIWRDLSFDTKSLWTVYDYLRLYFYCHLLDIVLVLVLITGTLEYDILHLGYLGFALIFFRMRLDILKKRNKIFKYLRMYNFALIVLSLAYQSPFFGGFNTGKHEKMNFIYEVIGFYKYDYGFRITSRSAFVEIVIFILVSIQSYIFCSREFDYVSRYLEAEQIGAIVREQEKKAAWKTAQLQHIRKSEEEKRLRNMQVEKMKAEMLNLQSQLHNVNSRPDNGDTIPQSEGILRRRKPVSDEDNNQDNDSKNGQYDNNYVPSDSNFGGFDYAKDVFLNSPTKKKPVSFLTAEARKISGNSSLFEITEADRISSSPSANRFQQEKSKNQSKENPLISAVQLIGDGVSQVQSLGNQAVTNIVSFLNIDREESDSSERSMDDGGYDVIESQSYKSFEHLDRISSLNSSSDKMSGESVSLQLRRILKYMWTQMRSNNDVVCYFCFIFVFLWNFSFMSMVYPAALFLYALCVNSGPTPLFWIIMLIYTEINILLQYLYQIIIQHGDFSLHWSLLPEFGFPMHRIASSFVIGTLPLFLVYVSTLLQCSITAKDGEWETISEGKCFRKTSLRQDEDLNTSWLHKLTLLILSPLKGSMQSLYRYWNSLIHGSEAPPYFVQLSMEVDEWPTYGIQPERIESGINKLLSAIHDLKCRENVLGSCRSASRVRVQSIEKSPENPNLILAVFEVIHASPVNGCPTTEWHKSFTPASDVSDEILKGRNMGIVEEVGFPYPIVSVIGGGKRELDLYAYIFGADLLVFFLVAIFYQSVIKNKSQFLEVYQLEDQFPKEYVFILMVIFFLIVLDRVIYLCSFALGKVIFYLFSLGLFTYAIMEYAWCVEPTQQRAGGFSLRAIYVTKAVSFALQALQIRYGIPYKSTLYRQFLTSRASQINYLCFRLYRALPFLYELRCVLDWSCTTTSLTMYDWLKLEDIHASLYLVKCDVDLYRACHKHGEKQTRITKFCSGVCLFFVLICVIWAPMLMYSSGNPTNIANPIRDVNVQIHVEGSDGKLTLYQTTLCTKTPWEELHSSQNLDPKGYLDAYNVKDIQLICCQSDAIIAWLVPGLVQDKFIQKFVLDKHPKFIFTWIFLRDRPKSKEEVKYEVTVEHLHPWEVEKVFNGSSDSFRLENIYPRYFRVTGSGEVRLLEQEVNYVSGDLQLNRGNLQWWSFFDINGAPGCDDLTGPMAIVVSEETPQGILGETLSKFSIWSLYITFVLAVGRFIRLQCADLRMRIPYENLPSCDRLIAICENIYAARAEGELEVEEVLYWTLVKIYRSPHMLLEYTKSD